jgi:hypothetical protein
LRAWSAWRQRARGVSVGELVRTACEKQYGIVPAEERAAAVRTLAALRLPVATPRNMKGQSVPSPQDLLP